MCLQLYDARTITVPADAYKKLSGTIAQVRLIYIAVLTPIATTVADSQKQYWDIKKKYRDVILFFKIGTFYELYEDDAQIGHDTLGWKMTITGVGHCRQVPTNSTHLCLF